MVKRERSSSPTIPRGPDPVTEGAMRYAPIPEKCRKGCPGFQANRRIWAEEAKKRLRGLNLEPVRVFIRDDGMVIDWQSPIPVMPDTLLPASASMQPPPRPCLQESPEVISVDGSERHTPAGRNGVHRASSRSSIASSRPSAPPVEVIDVDILDAEAVDVPISITKEVSYQPLPRRSTSRITNTSSQQPPYVSRPSNGAHQPSPAITAQRSSTPAPAHQPAKDPFEHITGTLPSPLSAKEEELQREALVFLCRYIRLFDRDRAALASAYSHLATFSVTTHDPSGSASRPSPRTVAQRLRQGRADVVTALLALPAARKFVPEGSRDVDYDVVCLDNKTEVLLMCYVGETKDQDGKVWACDQRFVLRQKACDLYDRSTEGVWPLVVVSHQITIRETVPPLPQPMTL